MPVEAFANAALFAVLGAVFGSFAALLSYRLPRGEPVLRGRSRCPSCGRALGAADLVPLLSWLVRRGRCAHCGMAVSARYPVIEVMAAALAVLAALRFGFSFSATAVALLGSLLVGLAASDLETGLLPNPLVAAVGVLGVVFAAFSGGNAALIDAALGAAAALVLVLIARFAATAFSGRNALGFGDVKLVAASGLWLGLANLPAFFIGAGIFGIGHALVWRATGRGETFPFGPAIAASLFACLLWLGGG